MLPPAKFSRRMLPLLSSEAWILMLAVLLMASRTSWMVSPPAAV
jgi:hypothetical protein